MKLHSGVFAAAMGASLLGIGSHPKTIRFYDALGARLYFRSLDALAPGDVPVAVRTLYPGAIGLRERPEWRTLRAQARAVCDTLPEPGHAPSRR
jgi:polysaccharide pyruvyl transferase WcaK-like protein